MPIRLYTERTYTLLMSAKLPAGAKSFRVPDTHPCFDQEQQELTAAYKAAFGADEATSTFKIAINKEGERAIYEPSILNKDGRIVTEWGSEYYALPDGASFSAGKCVVDIEVDDIEYSLKVRVIPIKKEDAKSKVQQAWAVCGKDDKVDFLAKAWAKGTITDIMAQSYPDIHKISEIVGTHDVIGFKMGSFDKYVFQLADKRWVRANTSVQNKLTSYEEMGIVVSPEEPARITVEPSTSQTSTGHPIYPVTMVSHRNVDLPVFDFADFGTLTTAVEDEELNLVAF